MSENVTPPKVAEMIRQTSDNYVVFMQQIAEHVDKLEAGIVQLQQRITELEGKANDNR